MILVGYTVHEVTRVGRNLVTKTSSYFNQFHAILQMYGKSLQDK